MLQRLERDETRDIATRRLVLRLMNSDVITACLAAELARAERLLGATIPASLLDHPSGLSYGQANLAADPDYAPWSARAVILPDTAAMIGLVRFHSRPDPAYLRRYARGAVELGYRIFPNHRRRGYGTEAVGAVMRWAQATFGVRRFIASVAPDNTASLRLIERFGFARIGEAMDEVDGLEHIYLRVAQAKLMSGTRGF
jgi:RimJ/RimL family protein N-acetyltransferase